MSPLLEEIVNALLPPLAREALGLQILEQLQAQSRAIGALDVEIVVSPQDRPAVASLLDRDFGFPLSITESDTIAEGQADIRFAETEQQIDLTGVLDGIDQAVKGFSHETRRTSAHG